MGKSYEAKRPSSRMVEHESCPMCGEGILVKVDENFISCDRCGFDIPIKEEDDGNIQGTQA